jgi:hypothetical protein
MDSISELSYPFITKYVAGWRNVLKIQNATPQSWESRGSHRRLSPAILTILAGFLLAAPPASSADSEGNFGVRGVGADQCDALLERLEQNPEVVLPTVSWLMGYITATNRLQADTFDVSPILDGETLLELTISTCGVNPDISYEQATFEVVRALSEARTRSQTPVVTMEAEDASTQIRRETLVQVQDRLRRLGHSSGPADGIYGPQTRDAIRAYQESVGLPASGVADSMTLLRLLVSASPDSNNGQEE